MRGRVVGRRAEREVGQLVDGHADDRQQRQEDDLEDGEVDRREQLPQARTRAGRGCCGRTVGSRPPGRRPGSRWRAPRRRRAPATDRGVRRQVRGGRRGSGLRPVEVASRRDATPDVGAAAPPARCGSARDAVLAGPLRGVHRAVRADDQLVGRAPVIGVAHDADRQRRPRRARPGGRSAWR